MKDLQEPAPLLGATNVPKGTVGSELQGDQEEKATRLAREATTEDDKNVKQQEATSGKAGADLSAQGSGTRTRSGSSSSEQAEAKKRPSPKTTGTKDEEGGGQQQQLREDANACSFVR